MYIHHPTDNGRVDISCEALAKTVHSSMGPSAGVDPTTHFTKSGSSTIELCSAPIKRKRSPFATVLVVFKGLSDKGSDIFRN